LSGFRERKEEGGKGRGEGGKGKGKGGKWERKDLSFPFNPGLTQYVTENFILA